MESKLIDDVVEIYKVSPQAQVEFKDENGVVHHGWAIAKPLNYDKEYFSEEERKAMAQEVLDGHAFAVHFTEDEIALGEVPTLYKRHMKAKGMEKPEIKEDQNG